MNLENNLIKFSLFRFALLALVLFVLGCSDLPKHNSPMVVSHVDGPTMVFSPYDRFTLRFQFWPELDETVSIRPDGKIGLQLVGDVEAAGKTPEELKADLERLYGKHLKNPEIGLIVQNTSRKFIFVGGEIQNDGLQSGDGLVKTITYTGPMTVFQSVLAAGGPKTTSAEMSNVVVIRVIDGKRYAKSFDLENELRTEEGEVFYLAPNDIVWVPRTRISKLNQWVDQYIIKMIPSQVATWTHVKDPRNTYELGQ